MQTDLCAPHLRTQCPGRGQLRGDVAELRLMASQAHGTRVHQAAGMSTVFPSSLCSRAWNRSCSLHLLPVDKETSQAYAALQAALAVPLWCCTSR